MKQKPIPDIYGFLVMVPSLHFRRTPENDGTGQKEGCVREKEKERRGRGSGVLFLPVLSRGVQSTFPENPFGDYGPYGRAHEKTACQHYGPNGRAHEKTARQDYGPNGRAHEKTARQDHSTYGPTTNYHGLVSACRRTAFGLGQWFGLLPLGG